MRKFYKGIVVIVLFLVVGIGLPPAQAPVLGIPGELRKRCGRLSQIRDAVPIGVGEREADAKSLLSVLAPPLCWGCGAPD